MPNFRLPELPHSSRALLERVVPPPNRPPLLYLAMAANTEILRQYVEGPILSLRGLLYTGQLSPGDRELVILRVTARRGAEHEWGVHVAYFGKTSGLAPSQVEATATDAEPTPPWSARQSAIIALADAVADVRALTNEQQRQIDDALDDAERVEILAVASQYLGISAICNVLAIPTEPGAPKMPQPTPLRAQEPRTREQGS